MMTIEARVVSIFPLTNQVDVEGTISSPLELNNDSARRWTSSIAREFNAARQH